MKIKAQKDINSGAQRFPGFRLCCKSKCDKIMRLKKYIYPIFAKKSISLMLCGIFVVACLFPF